MQLLQGQELWGWLVAQAHQLQGGALPGGIGQPTNLQSRYVCSTGVLSCREGAQLRRHQLHLKAQEHQLAVTA